MISQQYIHYLMEVSLPYIQQFYVPVYSVLGITFEEKNIAKWVLIDETTLA